MPIHYVQTLAAVGSSTTSHTLTAAVPARRRVIVEAAVEIYSGAPAAGFLTDSKGNTYQLDGFQAFFFTPPSLTPQHFLLTYSAYIETALEVGDTLDFTNTASLFVRAWKAREFSGIRKTGYLAGRVGTRIGTGNTATHDIYAPDSVTAPFTTRQDFADTGWSPGPGQLLLGQALVQANGTPGETWARQDTAWEMPEAYQEASAQHWWGLLTGYRLGATGTQRFKTDFSSAGGDATNYNWVGGIVAYLPEAPSGVASLHTAKGEYIIATPQDSGPLAVKRAAGPVPPFETSVEVGPDGALNPCLAQDPETERLYLLYAHPDGGVYQQYSDSDGASFTGEALVFANSLVSDLVISTARFTLRAAFVETDPVTGRGEIRAVAQDRGEATWGAEYAFKDAAGLPLLFEPAGFKLSYDPGDAERLLLLARPAGDTIYANWQCWNDGVTFHPLS